MRRGEKRERRRGEKERGGGGGGGGKGEGGGGERGRGGGGGRRGEQQGVAVTPHACVLARWPLHMFPGHESLHPGHAEGPLLSG